MIAKYGLEKKQQEIALLNKDKKLRTMINYGMLGGLLFVFVLSIVLYRSNQRKKRDNAILVEKNNQIEQQKEELIAQSEQLKMLNTHLEQQKEEILAQSENLKLVNAALEQQKEEILAQSELLQKVNQELEHQKQETESSIRYASRIQTAILPVQEQIKKHIPQSFIFYKPKDVVSGDFYWFAEKGDEIIIAAIDCTGHGVPGAFMSMIGDALLKQIVHDWEIYQPNKILELLHKGIIKSLQQENNENKDGMDIAICKWNNKTKELQFAGAMNPLYIVQKGSFEELKGDKQPIGGYQIKQLSDFSLHTIRITEPTQVYLFSDGFQDQFSEKENKKYKVKPFKELLAKISDLDAYKQQEIIENEFHSWKGNQEQTDDVLVIGLKLN
jgi:serine phosphatase RsbU (regulator of sigma subunit)